MANALFRFYEELNDYLPSGKRKKDFEVPLEGKKTAQEIIEKMGVPRAEVDLLLVNGQSVDLDYAVEGGDRVSVYPVFERLNIESLSRVREKPLRKLKFIVDNDLGGLVKPLQTMGVDVCSRGDLSRGQILQMAKEERRILLTQESDLLKSQEHDRMIVLQPGSIHEQVNQVIHALDFDGDRVGKQR